MKRSTVVRLDFWLLSGLVWREIRNRLAGGQVGWLWLVVAPLMLLAVYAFVFGFIFNARVPAGLEMPFIAWLAVALWPWLAFSESLLRGSQAIVENSALISKVALSREILVLSSQTAVFLLHLTGYAVVLVMIQLLGTDLNWLGLPYLLLVLFTLYLFAVGLGLMLAAILVFVRDLEQVLPTFIMFWFFMTPILYAQEILPAVMVRWLQLNPMLWWMEEIRNVLFHGKLWPDGAFAWLLVLSLVVLWLGSVLFRRLSPSFEDFL